MDTEEKETVIMEVRYTPVDFRVLDAQDESHHRGQVEERVSHERVPRELHHLATDTQVLVVKSPAATPRLITPVIYYKMSTCGHKPR